MMPCKRPFRSIEELHQREMDYLKRMWDSGFTIAVPAALHYCNEHRLNVPPWLLKAALDAHCALLRGDKPKKRGRAASLVARFRQDIIAYARWDAVCECREKQKEIRQQVNDLRARPNVPQDLLKEREKMLAWLGHDWLRAYECAAMLLKGSEAYAGPDAMKASYIRVVQLSRDPMQATRYHLLNPHLLRQLGLQNRFDARRDKKRA